MEALIILFGELAFALLAPIFTLFVDLVGAVVSAIAGAFGGAASGTPSASPRLRKAARVTPVVLTSVAVVMILGLGVVNQFFFDDAVRYIFDQAERRSGVVADCDSIDGSLFAGRVQLGDCSIRRTDHPTTTFEIDARRLNVDLRITSLLGEARFDEASVVGLDGWVATRSADTDTPGENADRPRRAFSVDRLQVADTRLRLTGVNKDGNAFELPIEVETRAIEPLRSRYALFDALFRSNARGSFAGAPFRIATAVIDDGRSTSWHAEDVPVASLGTVTGGLLAWFSSGTVDVSVQDEWQIDDNVSIDMDWQLDFADVEVGAPEGTVALTRLAAAPLTRYVNSLDGDFPMSFTMVVNESQFEFQSSLAASGLWDAVGESVNRVLEKFGVLLEDAGNTGNRLKEGTKSVLDRLRQPEDDDRE